MWNFESFWSAGNDELVSYLIELCSSGGSPGCWVWGPSATGKSHLLQAVCQRSGDRSVYLPLEMFEDAGPDVLAGLESRQIICLDDIDAIAGVPRWERSLFELCNQMLDSGAILIVAAGATQRECGFRLKDLESRFSRLPPFHIRPLADADRVRALQLRARLRGLDLPIGTANFLLTRRQRDMTSLYTLLDKLDLEALKAQRRLTIPFVKTVLAPDDK
ncbi:MAG: DnaA regulatory inactivator Hda [Woeseia sp.]